MDTPSFYRIMRWWRVIQRELLPELRNDLGVLTPKLEKVMRANRPLVSKKNEALH